MPYDIFGCTDESMTLSQGMCGGIEECKSGPTDIVVVKNISRLGKDTVKVLDAINTLRESQVRIIFKQEELDTLTVGSSLLISTIEACIQA